MSDRLEVNESLAAHPNIRTAAEMLQVAPSTLSRRADLSRERRGDREVVLAPGEVLRLAAVYRKRSLNDVAQDLLDLANEVGAEERRRVEEEIESFFDNVNAATERDELLRLARRRLPGALVEQIELSLDRDAPRLPDAIEGYLPLPDGEP